MAAHLGPVGRGSLILEARMAATPQARSGALRILWITSSAVANNV